VDGSDGGLQLVRAERALDRARVTRATPSAIALIAEARQRGLPALSLSVEPENPAARLYERLGLITVERLGGGVTMVVTLA
jgi:hypothetical protein